MHMQAELCVCGQSGQDHRSEGTAKYKTPASRPIREETLGGQPMAE